MPKNIMANEEIAQYEQCFLLSQYYKLHSIIEPIDIEIFPFCADMILKLSAADVLYVGKS